MLRRITVGNLEEIHWVILEETLEDSLQKFLGKYYLENFKINFGRNYERNAVIILRKPPRKITRNTL